MKQQLFFNNQTNSKTEKMEGDLLMFVKVWALAISSALYCYPLSKVRPGLPRLLFVLPVVFLFTTLPFALNSINAIAPTSFYLSWLANFKLLLFALDTGPLSQTSNNPLSIVHFVSIALLPIKVKGQIGPAPRLESNNTLRREFRKLVVFLCTTRLLMKKHKLPKVTVRGLYFVHVSLGVELLLAVTAHPIKALLGLDLEPQFIDPYLSTSLQDFWGSRWNLMTSNILRLTVYNPIRKFTSPMIGKRGGAIIGLIASFTVSGLMHELTYYHYTRVSPTWEVTWFFILHGVATTIEMILKSKFSDKWKPHRVVSMMLTSGFVSATATQLFMPQLLRNRVDKRLLSEYFIAIDYVKSFRFRS